jgi:hypothetical protein
VRTGKLTGLESRAPAQPQVLSPLKVGARAQLTLRSRHRRVAAIAHVFAVGLISCYLIPSCKRSSSLRALMSAHTAENEHPLAHAASEAVVDAVARHAGL